MCVHNDPYFTKQTNLHILAMILWIYRWYMAISSSSSGNNAPEREVFQDFRLVDNVKDAIGDIKKEVLSNNKEWNASWEALDNHIEAIFDKYANENNAVIMAMIEKDGYGPLQKILNDIIDKDAATQKMLVEIKETWIQNINLELNKLSLDVLKSSIQQNNTTNTPGNTSGSTGNTASNAPNTPFWKDPSAIREEYQSTNEFIDKDPKNRSYQALSPLTWNEGMDINGDEKVTDKEVKKSWILDRYRQSDVDVRKAVETILNFAEWEFSKKELKGIDRQSLGAILWDVVREYYEQSDKRDIKEFKKYFKENFVANKEYKKRWAGVNNDIKKILTILEKWLEEPGVEQALKHLADMWSKAKNINVVWASNDITHLESGAVNSKNIFLFLCDFDSDGSVNSTNVTKQKPNESRRDTWSVMGLQLYQNFAAKASIDDKNNIIDGPRTATLIRNIIIWVKSKADKDGPLFYAVNEFIKTQDALKTNGYSIQSFLNFMKGKDKYIIWGKQTKVIGVTWVKSYLESLAQETNEWSGDVADIFVNADERKEHLKNSAEWWVDVSRIYGVIDASLAKRWNDYGEETLAYTRRTIADKVIQSINYFTDSLYANLDTDRKLAQLFHGTTDQWAIGQIQQKFYFPDGTRNEQLIKDEVGKYINKKVVPSFGVAADEKGNPIIWLGVGVYKTSDDLTKRFQFNLNIGATLPVFNRADNVIPSDFRLGISIDIERTRQTKGSKVETKNQWRKDLVPTTRVWFVVGAWFEFVTQTIGLKAGIVVDRDFPAGIEQKGREFDRILKTILDPTENNFVNGNDYSSKLKQKIGILAEKNDSIKNNKRFLDDMADALGQKMEWAGVFDILNSPEYKADNGKKSTLLNFFYNQFIDGFHENAINQDLYNQLAGQWVKLTKVNIWVMIATTIAAIVLAPVTAWASSALMVAWFASMKLSTFKNSFVPDAYKTRGNYEQVQTHKNMDVAPEFTNLNEAAKYLEQQLNVLEPGKKNIIKVTPRDDGTFRIGLNGEGMKQRDISATSILSYLNIYYDTNDTSGFRFENGELILGKADLHIWRIVKRDKVEFHVMLGKNYKNMTKLSGPVHTETDKPLAGYEKTSESPKQLDKDAVESLINTIDWTNIESDKQKLIDFVWKEAQKNNPAITRWTLTLKKYPDGSYKLGYVRDETSDKLTLDYQVILDTKKTEWKEVVWSKLTIDLSKSFGYIENAKSDYQILRNDLESLEKNNKKSLFDTADSARRAKPDMLLWFLKPLSEDKVDYILASNALVKILENKKISAYDPFISKLKNTSLSIPERVLLCNKFRQLLAYNATSIKLLTWEWYSNINSLGWLISKRKNAYESMAKDSSLPEMFRINWDYYKTLTSQVSSWGTYELADAPEVMGYTAFYRTAAKSFGMAHPGETKIVKNGDKLAKIDVKEDDIEKTSDRYFNKLKANKENFTIIKNIINNQLGQAKSGYTIESVDDLKELVLSKKIEKLTNNKKTKEILTLDSKFVFYLMWECTNESLGLELLKITVSKQEEGPLETFDEGKSRTGSIAPGKKPAAYKIGWASGMYNNEYDIQTRQRDLTIGWAIKGMFKWKTPTDRATPDGQNPPIDGTTPGGQNPWGGWGNPGGENGP